MSARLLLEVALRILGIWLLFGALTKVTQAVAYYNSIALNSEPNIGNYFFAVAWVGIVELGLGLVLIFFAPRVAARFYPRDGEESMLHFRVGPGDIYHTACFVLGVCLLVAGIRAAGQLAVQAMSLGWPAIRLEGNMVTAIVYTTSGVLIIFGARSIGQLISGLQYDPNSIPRQQFSIKLILIVIGVVVVIWGAIRIMSVGGP